MSLRDRLEDIKNDTAQAPVHAPRPDFVEHKAYQELKSRIHRKLLDRVDLVMMESMAPEQLQEELKTLVERLLAE